MSGRVTGRKIRDLDGNLYVFELPEDVNADSIQDILISATQRITKFIAYKLNGDVYRYANGEPVGRNAGQYNYPYWRRIDLLDEETNEKEMEQEEFGEMMEEVLKVARDMRINVPRITTWRGETVSHDNKGYFIERKLFCAGENCNNLIIGRLRLSLTATGDNISRGQNFKPDDKRVTRLRPGSSKWLCPSCSPVSIPIHQEPELEPEEILQPVVEETRIQETEPEQVAPESIPTLPSSHKRDKKLITLLESLSNPTSETDPVFLKGFVYAITQLDNQYR